MITLITYDVLYTSIYTVMYTYTFVDSNPATPPWISDPIDQPCSRVVMSMEKPDTYLIHPHPMSVRCIYRRRTLKKYVYEP